MENKRTMQSSKEILSRLCGEWEGRCRTWTEPDVLSDESDVHGRFDSIFDNYVRHRYQGMYDGRARSGEDTIVFNPAKNKFESAWVDSFHMNYGIMYSVGEPTERGFFVLGKYDIAPGQPPWGWKTVFDFIDQNHLIITAHNITPDGQSAKGVETEYTRLS